MGPYKLAGRRVGPDCLAYLVTVLARHHDIGQDDIRDRIAAAGDGVVTVVDGDHLDVFAREADRHDLLDRDAVISQ